MPGVVVLDPVRIYEEDTFVVVSSATAIAQNKSMISLANLSGSSVRLRVFSISIRNVQTGAVTGVAATFELRRATSHSGGTSLTSSVVAYDTNNTLNGNISVRTGATITGESTSLLERWLWSSDEWGTGTADVESADHALQSLLPAWAARPVPLTLRADQSLTLKQTANSTAGTFDVIVVFSVV
jgi:hypothetical protein